MAFNNFKDTWKSNSLTLEIVGNFSLEIIDVFRLIQRLHSQVTFLNGKRIFFFFFLNGSFLTHCLKPSQYVSDKIHMPFLQGPAYYSNYLSFSFFLSSFFSNSASIRYTGFLSVPATPSSFTISGAGGSGEGCFVLLCFRAFAQALPSVQGHFPFYFLLTSSHLSELILTITFPKKPSRHGVLVSTIWID